MYLQDECENRFAATSQPPPPFSRLTQHKLVRLKTKQNTKARAHFSRRLIRERHSDNLSRGILMTAYKVCNTRSEYARLAGSGAREDLERARRRCHDGWER
jgi:hypothetical protein